MIPGQEPQFNSLTDSEITYDANGQAFVRVEDHRRALANTYCWGFACGAIIAAFCALCGALIASHPWM